MFTSIKQARQHGFNTKKTADGWQIGQLTIDGWVWSAYSVPTRRRALRHAYYIYSAHK